MNFKVVYSLIFLVIALLASSCRKDEEQVLLPENTKRIAGSNYKDWQLEKVSYLFLDVTGRIPDCQQDEIYRFYTDGRGEILSGPNACTSPEPEVQTSGSWEFTGQGETLIVNWKDEQNWEAVVDELTPDKLVVTGTVFDGYTVTATFRPL